MVARTQFPADNLALLEDILTGTTGAAEAPVIAGNQPEAARYTVITPVTKPQIWPIICKDKLRPRYDRQQRERT